MDKQVNESGLEPKEEIQELVRRSREAQKQIENYTQEQVDELIRAMVWCVARPGVAEEIAQLTRNQILVQTSTAMVGQSNLIPQSVLQLLV